MAEETSWLAALKIAIFVGLLGGLAGARGTCLRVTNDDNSKNFTCQVP
jgi:hypothetical protein